MTSLAKIAANRENAKKSTGPRTAHGKAAAAMNAVRHAVFAAAPVVPGEDPAAWAAHLAGVLASLAPVGLLEERLAGRAAAILWRLDRVTRFEAASVAAGVESAVLPRPTDEGDPLDGFDLGRAADLPEALVAARDKARKSAKRAARAEPLVAYMGTFADRPDDEPVPAAVAVGVLTTACRALDDYPLKATPPGPKDAKFLAQIGHPGVDAVDVPWTAGVVRLGFQTYAGLVKGSTDWLAGLVSRQLRAGLKWQRREHRREQGRADGLAERRRRRPVWRAVTELLPGGGVDERVIRYESHLGKQLSTTLHELERLQALRAGRAVSPPVAVEATVNTDPAGG